MMKQINISLDYISCTDCEVENWSFIIHNFEEGEPILIRYEDWEFVIYTKKLLASNSIFDRNKIIEANKNKSLNLAWQINAKRITIQYFDLILIVRIKNKEIKGELIWEEKPEEDIIGKYPERGFFIPFQRFNLLHPYLVSYFKGNFYLLSAPVKSLVPEFDYEIISRNKFVILNRFENHNRIETGYMVDRSIRIEKSITKFEFQSFLSFKLPNGKDAFGKRINGFRLGYEGIYFFDIETLNLFQNG